MSFFMKSIVFLVLLVIAFFVGFSAYELIKSSNQHVLCRDDEAYYQCHYHGEINLRTNTTTHIYDCYLNPNLNCDNLLDVVQKGRDIAIHCESNITMENAVDSCRRLAKGIKTYFDVY